MTDTTVPNKLFDYMAGGLPVAVSSAKPLKRIVTETGCGVTFRSGDASSCASALAELSSPAKWQYCSTAGVKAVASKYNWSMDAERLRRVFDTIV
jgi:glycosyltransferase involved in cell wall biosynthesis